MILRPLYAVIEQAQAVLLDFDGPVCNIFAGYPAAQIAGELLDLAIQLGHDELEETDDPLQVLRNIGRIDNGGILVAITRALRLREVEAARSAVLTPGVDELIWAIKRSGRLLAIVSNNSPEAVEAYLRRVGLRQAIHEVIGRDDHLHPTKMKPSPHLLYSALQRLATRSFQAVMVGDSLSDIEAAHRAQVPVIGYANRLGKRQAFIDAHADAVIGAVSELTQVLGNQQHGASYR